MKCARIAYRVSACLLALLATRVSAQAPSREDYGNQAPPPVRRVAAGQPANISLEEWEAVLRRLRDNDAELQALRAAQGIAPPPVGAANELISLPPVDPRVIHADGVPHATPVEHRLESLEQSAGKASPPRFPTAKLTGFFHLDSGFYHQDPTSLATLGDIQDGTGFRRARLQAVGSVAEFTNYSIEMDFANAGRPTFMDVWGEQTNLPLLGSIRIGHFRQPVSMESYTPIRQLPFLERALPFQAFDPFRRVGVMAYDKSEDQSTAWQNSVYKTGGFGNSPLGDSRFATDIGDVGGYSYATRMTHLLHYDEPAEGRYLAHIGGNFSYSSNTGNGLPGSRFYEARAIPEFFVGDPAAGGAVVAGTPFFADTGRIPARDFLIYGVELAGQYGPLHLQSEYMVTAVNQIGGPTLFYDGAYAQAGFFLTGEHRSYNRTFGAFDSVTPFEDFFSIGRRNGICGWGAWEVTGRVSYVNLNDPRAMPIGGFAVNPGRLTDSTIGLNWHWNAFAKLQFNWIHAWLDNRGFGNSDTDIYAMRTQIQF